LKLPSGTEFAMLEPASRWSAITAALGRRRLKLRGTRLASRSRRPQFEALETRQLLTATSATSSDQAGFVVAGDVASQLGTSRFVIAGGSSAKLFEIGHSTDAFGYPSFTLAPSATAYFGDALQHEVVVEEWASGAVATRYTVSITLAGEEFLAKFREERVDRVRSAIVSQGEGINTVPLDSALEKLREQSTTQSLDADSPRSDVLVLAAERLRVHLAESSTRQAGAEQDTESRKGLYQSLLGVKSTLDGSRELLVRDAASSSDLSFAQLKELLAGPSPLADASSLGAARSTPHQEQRTSQRQIDGLQQVLESAAVLLQSQIAQDLRSSDPSIQALATQVRDAIVAESRFSQVLWSGWGVNSPIQVARGTDRAGQTASVIYEAGPIDLLGAQVRLDQPAVISVRRQALPGWRIANASAAAGTPASDTALADTHIAASDPNASYGASTELWAATGSFMSQSFEYDSLIKFDLSGYSQYTGDAVVTLQPFSTFGTSVPQTAHVVQNNAWTEAATWNTDPGLTGASTPVRTIDGKPLWHVTSAYEPVELDVSQEVRRTLRQGDVDISYTRGSAVLPGTSLKAVAGDVAAFEDLVKRPSAYLAQFAELLADDRDLMDRADANRDGTIDAKDGIALLAIHGFNPGDADFDGASDALGFLQWQMMFGGIGDYAQGDFDFSGVISGADMELWADYFGLPAPTPASEELTLRVEAAAPADGPFQLAAYRSREYSVADQRPKLHVEQPYDFQLRSFEATTHGSLRLKYNVLNAPAPSPVVIQIYRSPDGVTYAPAGLLQTVTVATPADLVPGVGHSVDFAVNFDAPLNLAENERLIAVVADPGGPDVGPTYRKAMFRGGAVRDAANGIVYLLGTDADDAYRLSMSGTTLTLQTAQGGTQSISVSPSTELEARLYAGDDLLLADATLTLPTTQYGGAGNDLLYGGSAANALFGGEGSDVLVASGSDSLDWGNLDGQPDNVVVTTLRDELDPLGELAFTPASLSLREAVELVESLDYPATISFASHELGVIRLEHGQIDIHGQVVIAGPDSESLVIDALGAGRAFAVAASAEATLSGLSITGGAVTPASPLGNSGGAIHSVGDLRLADVKLFANTTDTTVVSGANIGRGGAIYSKDGTLELTSVRIEGNSAQNGGGIYAEFAGSDSLTIDRSTIVGNIALNASNYGFGGGVFLQNVWNQASTEELQILNSTIAQNRARFGAGVSVVASGTLAPPMVSVRVVNATIVDNSAGSLADPTIPISGSHSAGIYKATNAAVTMHNSILARNTAGHAMYQDLLGTFSSASSHNLVGQVANSGLSTVNGNRFGTESALKDPLLTESLVWFSPLVGGYLPLPTSEAINNASASRAAELDSDQRGASFQRTRGTGVDIGSLEASVLQLLGGQTLEVYGSNGPDGISVRGDDLTAVTIEVDSDGGVSFPFDLNAVSAVTIYANDASDIVSIASSLPYGVTVYGGAGDDAIYGGAGDDVLYGEAGNDVLFGNGGDDHIDGGAGRDLIDGGLGSDSITANANEDDVHDEDPTTPPLNNPPLFLGIASADQDLLASPVYEVYGDTVVSIQLWGFDDDDDLISYHFGNGTSPLIQYGDSQQGIASATLTNGLFQWTVPNGASPGTSYTVEFLVRDYDQAEASATITLNLNPRNSDAPGLHNVSPDISHSQHASKVTNSFHPDWPRRWKEIEFWQARGQAVVGAFEVFVGEQTSGGNVTVRAEVNSFVNGDAYTFDKQTKNKDLNYRIVAGPGEISNPSEGVGYATFTATFGPGDATAGYRTTIEVYDSEDPEQVMISRGDVIFYVAPSSSAGYTTAWDDEYLLTRDTVSGAWIPIDTEADPILMEPTSNDGVGPHDGEAPAFEEVGEGPSKGNVAWEIIEEYPFPFVHTLKAHFVYTPKPTFDGYDAFSYRILDTIDNHGSEDLIPSAETVVHIRGPLLLTPTFQPPDRDQADPCACACQCSNAPLVSASNSNGTVSISVPTPLGTGTYMPPQPSPVIEVGFTIPADDPYYRFASPTLISVEGLTPNGPVPTSRFLQGQHVGSTAYAAGESGTIHVTAGAAAGTSGAYEYVVGGTFGFAEGARPAANAYSAVRSYLAPDAPATDKQYFKNWVHVVQQDDIGFGKGWNFAGVERLIHNPFDPDTFGYTFGDVLPNLFTWIDASGFVKTFFGLGSKANNDPTSSTISHEVHQDDGRQVHYFVLTDKFGTRTYFPAAVLGGTSNDHENGLDDRDLFRTGLSLAEKKVDIYGNTATWTYADENGDGVVAEVQTVHTSIDNHTTTFHYNSNHRVEAIEDFAGRQVKLVYGQQPHDSDRLLRIELPHPTEAQSVGGGPASKFTYDLAGRITSVTDADENVTTYSYDSNANLLEIVHPDGVKSSLVGSRLTDFDRVFAGHTFDDGGTPAGAGSYPTGVHYRSFAFGAAPVRTGRYIDELGRVSEFTSRHGLVLSWTDALGNRTQYERNNDGLVTKITLPELETGAQLVTTYEYDELNNLTKTVHPDGSVELWTYDALSRPLSNVDPLGVVTLYEYSDYDLAGSSTFGAHRVIVRQIVGTDDRRQTTGFPDDIVAAAYFTPQGLLHKTRQDIWDEVNRTYRAYETAYFYTTDDKWLTSVRYAPGTPEEAEVQFLAHDPYGNATLVRDEEGRETTFAFNALDQLTTVVSPGVAGPNGLRTPVLEFTYTAAGRIETERLTSSEDQAKAIATRYEYDSRGRLKKVTDDDGALNAWTETTYDPAGNPVAVEVLVGWINDPTPAAITRSVEFTYDQLNRNVSVVQPDPDDEGPLDAPVSYAAYDVLSGVRGTVDPLGGAVRRQHDYLRRTTEVIAALGARTRTTYNALGQPLSATDSAGRTTIYGYDGAGRLSETALPGQYDAPMVRRYTTASQLAAAFDPLGNATHYRYDLQNRLLEEVDPQGGAVRYAYNRAGQLTSLTDPVGNTTRWEFDAGGRTVAEIDPLGLETTYAYDEFERLVRTTDRLGRSTEYAYNALHQLEQEIWKDAAGATVNTIDYDFNLIGELESIGDATSIYSFAYDNLSRATQSTQTLAGLTPTIQFDHAYDRAGNLRSSAASIGIPGDFVADFVNHYAYDTLHRPTQITQSAQAGGNSVAPKRVDFAYDADSRLETISRFSDLAGVQNEVESRLAYDDRGLLTSIDHGSVVTHGYTWDDAFRLTQYANSLDGTVDYAYDATGQLTGADYAGSQVDEAYHYDAAGNRTNGITTLHGTNRDYATGPHNQLLFDGLYHYAYDAEGNRTRRWLDLAADDVLGPGDTDVTEYAWDHRNRLVQVTNRTSYASPSAQVVDHAYDVFNRPIGRTVDPDGATGLGAIEQTFYLYDQGQIALEFRKTGDGAVQASDLRHRYLWGPAVDMLLADEQTDRGPGRRDPVGAARPFGERPRSGRQCAANCVCTASSTPLATFRARSTIMELARRSVPGPPATWTRRLGLPGSISRRIPACSRIGTGGTTRGSGGG
jgi:YD repeat-containing protein